MNNVISFLGGDSQVGTTMISQGVAEALAEQGKKTLFVMGSGKVGNEFIGLSNVSSIDDVKANIISGKVLFADIQPIIEHRKGVDIIPACRNPYGVKFFPENTFQILLESVIEDYDFIIIDGGDDVNLGITMSALNITDKRYFIITQQKKGVDRLNLLKTEILEALDLTGKIIINKYLNNPSLYLKHEINEVLKMEVVATVPYVDYGWQAEIEGRTLMHCSKYSKAIEKIIAEFTQVEKKEKRWIKSFV